MSEVSKRRRKVGWTNRKLFTVRFKDREPRALLWRKKVYEEWFHYAKLAQENKRKIPRAFGNLRKFDNFEDWWRDERYGFELFCERPMKTLVSEVKNGNVKLDANEVLIKVNLKGDLEILERDLRKLLLTKDTSEEYESNARFQPSRPMKYIGIGVTESDIGTVVNGKYVFEKRANKLQQYRETYRIAQTKSYKETALELGWIEGDREWYRTKFVHKDGTVGIIGYEYQKEIDNKVKKVKRHVDQVESIFNSIENGTFP